MVDEKEPETKPASQAELSQSSKDQSHKGLRVPARLPRGGDASPRPIAFAGRGPAVLGGRGRLCPRVKSPGGL